MNRGALKGFGESAKSGKPIRILRFTSGSFVFRPLVQNSLIVVTIDGGGGGGGGGNATNGGGGGGAGARVRKTLRVSGPVNGIVGAKGLGGVIDNPGTAGSLSRFGTIVAPGGGGGLHGSVGGGFGAGGFPSTANGQNEGSTAGGAGASGRNDSTQVANSAPGFSSTQSTNGSALSGSGLKPGGAGGDSMRGSGGAGGNGGGAASGFPGSSPSPTAYGAGGGGGGGGSVTGAVGADGVGGCIEIEEYGA